MLEAEVNDSKKSTYVIDSIDFSNSSKIKIKGHNLKLFVKPILKMFGSTF